MWDTIKSILQSKKALAAIVGMIATLFGKIGWNISAGELLVMVSPIVAYIVGQGIADNGKEAAKVNRLLR